MTLGLGHLGFIMPEIQTATEVESRFLDPEKLVKRLSISPGSHVADFGCGSGFFTIPLARAVGAQGKVFAIDVVPQALEAVASKSRLEGLLQIETIRADLELEGGSRLAGELVDLVLIANILFQAKKKDAVLAEAHRILKAGGRLVMVEWQADSSFGPEKIARVSQGEAKRLAEGAGFRLREEFAGGLHHYVLIFEKQEARSKNQEK